MKVRYGVGNGGNLNVRDDLGRMTFEGITIFI